MIVTYQSIVAEHTARNGRVAEATELGAGARRQVDELGMGWEEIPLLVAEGVIAAVADDGARSAERFATAITVAHADGCHVLARRAATTAAELGVDLGSP